MSTRPGVGGPKLRRLNMGYVFIILAIISFVITFFIFKGIMGNKSADADTKPFKTKPLVVATQHVYPGEVLTEDTLKVVDWPEANYPPADVYVDLTTLVGRAVKSDVFPGQPVYRLSLAGETSDGGLPVIIPKGYRAMTILVTENKGVGGFVKPGDRVDILGTFEYRSQDEGDGQESMHVTQTVLQDIQVLAIAQEMYQTRGSDVDSGNQSANSGSAPPVNPTDATKAKIVSSVTLAVTPEQAEVLAFADSRGDLRLTLRPDNEHEQLELAGALSSDVVRPMGMAGAPRFGGFEDDAEEPLEDPGEPVEDDFSPSSFGGGNTIEIFEGTEKSSVSF